MPVLEGGEAIVHEDVPLVALHTIFLLVDNGVAAAFLQGSGSKLVTVERGAFERDEDTAFGAVAAVGRHHGVLAIKFI